jgi:hypothetical protein
MNNSKQNITTGENMKTLEEALEYIKQLEVALEAQKEVTDRNVRRFFIPTIGTTIKIIKDTPVDLYFESRNEKFIEKVKGEYQHGFEWESYAGRTNHVKPPEWAKCVKTLDHVFLKTKVWCCEWVIPKDTLLVVDRIYIRKGKDMKEFDSITFRVEKQKGSKLTGRFWLKRSDVNNLVVEVVKEEP